MLPALIAIDGPLKGVRFPLSAPETHIGRVGSNPIAIHDLSVSRRHCVIQQEGERHTILDLDSHNGTFVNGTPIKQKDLADGDRINIGSSCFLFRIEDEPSSGSVHIEDGSLLPSSSVMTMISPRAEVSKGNAALFKLSAIADLVRDIYRSQGSAKTDLERNLFKLIFELIPADRGAFFLADAGGEPFFALCGFDRKSHQPTAVAVSRGVLDQIVKDRAAMAANQLQYPATHAGVNPVTAVLAAPLLLSGRLIGILYLDTRDDKRNFVEPDLELATAICGISAMAVETARKMESLEVENRRLRSEINVEHSMIGESVKMQNLFRMVGKVAPGTSTVLIRGESGTGKELVARAIHRNSPRANMPFTAINCAALTETLLESEFFGYEKGAFTGAQTQRKGKLEVAEGGTLFLDEIGEMPPALQVKLLRVLQEHEFERVGGTRTVKVNIRLIAATNRNLEAAMQSGSFRNDLFFRLNVVVIEVPPLRDRREDIPLLAAWFSKKFAASAGRTVTGLSPESKAAVVNYDWPGNVRELENAIERAVVLGSTDLILPEDLPEAILESSPSAGDTNPRSFHEAIKASKRRLIQDALEQTGGSFTEAAKLLCVHPNYLHRLVTNLQLRKTQAP